MQFSGPPQTIESKQLASGGTAGGAFTADAGGAFTLMPEEVREVRVGYGCAGAAGGVWLRWCCAGAALVLRWCCTRGTDPCRMLCRGGLCSWCVHGAHMALLGWCFGAFGAAIGAGGAFGAAAGVLGQRSAAGDLL